MTPVLIFDGDCGICTRLAGYVPKLRARADVQPHQRLDLPALGLSSEECDAALQFVDADGRVYAAQDAVAALLLHSAPPLRPIGVLLRVPGVHALAGLAYRWVARNRHRLPGGTPACAMTQPGAAGQVPETAATTD